MPYLPLEPMPYTAPSVSWRRWVFDQLHCSFTQNHRTFMETFSLLRRTAHWPYLARDCAEWHRQCEVCAQYRGATMRPPMKSIYAQEACAQTLPWEDVIIDVQGPFTKSEEGHLYLLSYHCSRLRVCLLEPFKSVLGPPKRPWDPSRAPKSPQGPNFFNSPEVQLRIQNYLSVKTWD